VTGDPTITESARKHGVDAADIFHPFSNPISVEDLDEGLVILVGPDHAGRLLEIGAAIGSEGPVVVHAMEARQRYLR